MREVIEDEDTNAKSVIYAPSGVNETSACDGRGCRGTVMADNGCVVEFYHNRDGSKSGESVFCRHCWENKSLRELAKLG